MKSAPTNAFMTMIGCNLLSPRVSGQWHFEKTRMLIAVTGNHASKDKSMRKRMTAAGYERADIGYNEMPVLNPFPASGVQTLRTARHEEN